MLTAVENEQASFALQKLGYEVVENNNCFELELGGTEYSFAFLYEGDDDYFIIPVGSTNSQYRHLFNLDSNGVCFLHTQDLEQILYMFKASALIDLLKPVVEKIESSSLFGFTNRTANDFKRIHVRQDDEDHYYKFIHVPVDWVLNNVKHIKKVVEKAPEKSDNEDFQW